MVIRQARQGEEDLLTAIAIASKSHWGYTPAQLDAWHAGLTITSATLANNLVYVADVEGTVAGFFVLAPAASRWELEHLWVRPDAMGRGVGKALLAFGCELAADAGASAIAIDADPNAEPFYLACGATRTGAVAAPTEEDPLRVRPQLWLAC